MLRTKTLLIVGAGASNEFGLPVGQGLMKEIGDVLSLHDQNGRVHSGSQHIVNALSNNRSDEFTKLLSACHFVSRGIEHAKSIDNFIFTHSDNPDIVLVSKIAIVDRVLAAEARSNLFQVAHYGASWRSYGENWMNVLTANLYAGFPRLQAEKAFDELSIICFNYDKCIETYFCNSLVKYFGMSQQHAINAIKNIDVVHPYGVVSTPFIESDFHFGSDNTKANLLSLSKNIKTFYEGIDDVDQVQEIKRMISESGKIVFLGFGYIEQNMKLLDSEPADTQKLIYATAKGMSGANTEYASTAAEQCFRSREGRAPCRVRVITDLTCSQILTDYAGELFRS